MHRHKTYLKRAGIAWEDAEGRRADFHAFRHTYGTLLSLSGVSPREAMELMRHTDLKLTMKVYTDPRIFDLAEAVEKLPLPSPAESQALTATSTAGEATASAGVVCQKKAERLVGRLAGTTASHPSSLTVTGSETALAEFSQTLGNAGDRQQKIPIDRDGAKARQVGLEATPMLSAAMIHKHSTSIALREAR